MSKTVKIIIDDVEYEVPKGSNLVDVAKWHANNDIPVFCYHPKMDPVGMCRMCLVELGMIHINYAMLERAVDSTVRDLRLGPIEPRHLRIAEEIAPEARCQERIRHARRLADTGADASGSCRAVTASRAAAPRPRRSRRRTRRAS